MKSWKTCYRAVGMKSFIQHQVRTRTRAMNHSSLLHRPLTSSPSAAFAVPILSSWAHFTASPSSLKWDLSAGLGPLLRIRWGKAEVSKQKRVSLWGTRATMVQTEMGVTWEGLETHLGGKKFGPQPRVAHLTERIFGPGNDASKLVFYRDNSAWCPYCERLWLLLEEKQLNYTVEKINMWCYGEKPEWYTRMVPSGLLPAVVLDGKLLTESLDIMLYLESKFSDKNPMLPRPGSRQYSVLDELLRLERRLFGAWLNRLKGRPGASFDTTMDAVNEALKTFGGPYFLGNEFSLVDCVYAPFLERIAASMPYWPGIKVRGNDRWPAVNSWYDAMDSRPAYQGIKSDDFYIVHNLEPQIGACRSEPAGAAWRAHIDGTAGSWDLPLKPEVTAWGADDGTGKDGAREEAAQCFIKNHEAVVKFAMRGVQDQDDSKNAEAVDLGLRYVAKALLVGTDNVQLPKNFPRKDVVAGAAGFLMNKVGVPRDLTYPAARQLRGNLLWLSRHCQQS